MHTSAQKRTPYAVHKLYNSVALPGFISHLIRFGNHLSQSLNDYLNTALNADLNDRPLTRKYRLDHDCAGSAGMIDGMEQSQEHPVTRSLDQWIAEMGGEPAVASMIEETKRQVADGSLMMFRDRNSFLEHFGRGRHSKSA